MNKLVECKNKYSEGKGMEENKIQEEETSNNIQFPIAYKEFLKLSGLDFYAAKINTEYDYLNQQRAKDLIKKYKLGHLIKKDF